MLIWKGQKIDRKQHVIVIHEMQKTILVDLVVSVVLHLYIINDFMNKAKHLLRQREHLVMYQIIPIFYTLKCFEFYF